MDAGPYHLVEELFLGSADLPLHERERFLSGSCSDLMVLAEVRSLLAHDGRAAGVLTEAIPVNAAALLLGTGIWALLR